MGIVVQFSHWAACEAGSKGYKSGRNSWREMPVARSTPKTRVGGTTSHCETACGVIANSAAIFSKPTAALALSRAALGSDMIAHESMASLKNQGRLHCCPKGMLYNADMSLGNRIRTARKKAMLTQRDVGRACGVSSQAVSQWERDEVVPEFDKLNGLMKTLKISAEWLLAGAATEIEQDEIRAILDRLDPVSRRRALKILRSLIDDSDQAA